jgi:archaellum biogenesis protein FlaJ (TadC family)
MRENKPTRLKLPLPKEHGSWAMFAVPVIIGLIVAAQWQWRSILLIASMLGLFLVRFPIDLLIKTRKRPTADRAWLIRWVVIYGSITVLCGLWLIVVDRLYALIGLGLIGVALLIYHGWLVERRKEMSVRGELAGIVGLALGAPLAYYVAQGVLDSTALSLWIVNALYFGGTVFYIKLKVRQQPKEPAPDHVSERLVKAKACLSYQSVVLTLLILLVALHRLPALALLAFVPMTLKVLYGATRWQDRQSLSLPRLGLIEMFHSVLFAALIIAAF